MQPLWNKINNNIISYNNKYIMGPSLQNNMLAIYVYEKHWYPQICLCHIWHIDISMVSIMSALHIYELICRRAPGRCVCMRHHLFHVRGRMGCQWHDSWRDGNRDRCSRQHETTEYSLQDVRTISNCVNGYFGLVEDSTFQPNKILTYLS